MPSPDKLQRMIELRRRDEEIYALRKQGVSLRQVGARYGLTAERIRQIERAERALEQQQQGLSPGVAAGDAAALSPGQVADPRGDLPSTG